MESKKDVNVKEDREVISRRSFMRKSAEVAALSLFGVMGLDAITGRVLERIAESEAMGGLADSAANTLKEHRLDYYVSADMPNCQKMLNPVTCEGRPDKYYCQPEWYISCNQKFVAPPSCSEEKPFKCSPEHNFACGVVVECDTTEFKCCPADYGHFSVG